MCFRHRERPVLHDHDERMPPDMISGEILRLILKAMHDVPQWKDMDAATVAEYMGQTFHVPLVSPKEDSSAD